MLERYGVGRPSLREALRILEDHGLIVMRSGPGGGPVVARPGSREFGRVASLFFQVGSTTLRELGEALEVIEPVMARQAAERLTPEGRLELLEHCDSARRAACDDNQAFEATDDFHRIVARLSANGVLRLVATAVRELYDDRVLGPVSQMQGRILGQFSQVLDAHDAIASAIVDRRSSDAEALMRQHIVDFTTRTARRYPELLDQVIVWT